MIIGNFVFYGYAGVTYLLYFAGCILFNYFISKRILNSKRKNLLIFGIVFNIGLLGILKYYNFFISSINGILKTNFNLMHVFLPLGLSYFTFQFVSVFYDCYKGKISQLNFTEFVLYVSFFPKIVQGPIMLFSDFEKQLNQKKAGEFQIENFSKGLYAFAMGLAKKIVIADALADFVNPAFSGEYRSAEEL
ncbi:MAG: MBOAT family O-acyltransferase [Schaedlerella sp.]|nr:MBOAT family O-acyltransferase [Schaedlerella sp.]